MIKTSEFWLFKQQNFYSWVHVIGHMYKNLYCLINYPFCYIVWTTSNHKAGPILKVKKINSCQMWERAKSYCKGTGEKS